MTHSPSLANDNASDSHYPAEFVDFYDLLGVPGDADTDLVVSRINDLYSEAQMSREHRHLARRREAEKTLDLLPVIMGALGTRENRASYDAYAVAARAGAAPTDFPTFLSQVDDSIAERGGLLGLSDTVIEPNRAPEPAAPVRESPMSDAPIYAGADASSAGNMGTPAPMPAPTATRKGGNWPITAGVAIASFVLLDAVVQLPPVVTLVLVAVAGVATWMATGGAKKAKTPVGA